jgi:hypothetical protein
VTSRRRVPSIKIACNSILTREILKASAAFVFPIYTRVFQHDGEEIADKGQVRGCKGYYSRKWVSLSLILIKDKCELVERIMGRDFGGTCRRKRSTESTLELPIHECSPAQSETKRPIPDRRKPKRPIAHVLSHLFM